MNKQRNQRNTYSQNSGRFQNNRYDNRPRETPQWVKERKYAKCGDCGTSFLIKYTEFPEGKYANLFKQFCEQRNAKTLFIHANDCPTCTPDSLFDLRQDIDHLQSRIVTSNTLASKRAKSQQDIARIRNEIRREAQAEIDYIKAEREPRLEQYKQLSQVRDYGNRQNNRGRGQNNRNQGQRQYNRGRSEQMQKDIANAPRPDRVVETKSEKVEEPYEQKYPSLPQKPYDPSQPTSESTLLVGFADAAAKEFDPDSPPQKLKMLIPTKPCSKCGKDETAAFSHDNHWYWLCNKCAVEELGDERKMIPIVDENDYSDDEVPEVITYEDSDVEQ